MLKLRKYLKKYWLALLCIVALLYTQAQTVLALPDYMSDIITYGIQARGFDTNVPDLVSKDTLDKVAIFMSEDDYDYVLKQYEFKDFTDIKQKDLPYEIDLSDNSIVKEHGLYVLKNDITTNSIQKLSSVLRTPMLMVSGMQALEAGDSSFGGDKQGDEMKDFLSQLPPGMSLFDALRMMPKEEIKKLIDNSTKAFEGMGESSMILAGSNVVEKEYKALGIDVSAIQNNYIMDVGLKMLAVALLGGVCTILVGYFASIIAAGVGRKMRQDVFEKVQSFSSAELTSFSTASLITRTTNDVQQIQQALVMTLRIVIYSPILAVGAIIKVLDSSQSMVWIIALVVVVIMALVGTTMAIVAPKFNKVQELADRLNLVMREALTGMLVIRAFHTEDVEEARFEKANDDTRKVNLFVGRTFALMMPLVTFVMNAATLLIVWVGSHQVDLGNMQIGDMMAFLQYAMQIIMSFMMIAFISIMLSRASVSSKRIFEVLETPLSIADPEVPREFINDEKGYVEFKDVSFRYPGAEEDVLTDISFTAKPRETTAFIGSTGSGKSTIINLIPRFFDVTKGSVEVDGVDIRDVTQHDLRSKIGLVPQKGVLFSGTIESNIKYSDEEMSNEQMVKASQIAQAEEFISIKEEGYETTIAQGGSNVSGGQKQRLAIARAIAKEPEIFIFDDSFSALDFKTDSKVREAIDKLCKQTGSTILLVAQRISSIMHADQIIVLDEGKVIGKGTHEQLMETCDVYQEIAYSQLSKEELGHE